MPLTPACKPLPAQSTPRPNLLPQATCDMAPSFSHFRYGQSRHGRICPLPQSVHQPPQPPQGLLRLQQPQIMCRPGSMPWTGTSLSCCSCTWLGLSLQSSPQVCSHVPCPDKCEDRRHVQTNMQSCAMSRQVCSHKPHPDRHEVMHHVRMGNQICIMIKTGMKSCTMSRQA